MGEDFRFRATVIGCGIVSVMLLIWVLFTRGG
jgi:hypothetical protein